MTTSDSSRGSEGTMTAAFAAFCNKNRTKFFEIIQQMLVRPAKGITRKSSLVQGHTGDLIDAVLGRASRRGTPWASKEHMIRWLFAALRSAEIDLVRTNAKFAPNVSLENYDLPAKLPECSIEDKLALAESLQRLRTDCPNAFRVIDLRFMEGLSLQDVAAELNTTVYAVRTLERNGLSFLQRQMNS